jgi:hypothetical protein
MRVSRIELGSAISGMPVNHSKPKLHNLRVQGSRLRLVFGVKDTPEEFLGVSGFADVIDLGNVEIACRDYITDVAVMLEQLLLLCDLLVLVFEGSVQVVDFRLAGQQLYGVCGGLIADCIEFCLEVPSVGLRLHQFPAHVGPLLRTVTRTAALGGRRDKCIRCGHLTGSYNSCRNRHCPKCHGDLRAKWLAARSAELLPVLNKLR